MHDLSANFICMKPIIHLNEFWWLVALVFTHLLEQSTFFLSLVNWTCFVDGTWDIPAHKCSFFINFCRFGSPEICHKRVIRIISSSKSNAVPIWCHTNMANNGSIVSIALLDVLFRDVQRNSICGQLVQPTHIAKDGIIWFNFISFSMTWNVERVFSILIDYLLIFLIDKNCSGNWCNAGFIL